MKAPKSLRQPDNWQDFEMLCKKLWGEIWQCPEIKKNGRLGQSQNGVDLSGVPKGEQRYYGVQCKLKSEYKKEGLKEVDLIKEIQSAKSFSPPLKKLYIASTASRDAKIETFIREKNIEHIKNDSFEVHIFFWEDIVELIDENPETYRFYINNKNLKENRSVDFTFIDGSEKITLYSKFKKSTTSYILRAKRYRRRECGLFDMLHFDSKNYRSKKVNLSYCAVKFKLKNSGTVTLSDYKVLLTFESSDIIDMSYSNHHSEMEETIQGIANPNPPRRIRFNLENKSAIISPPTIFNNLVGDDELISETLYLKFLPKDIEVPIKWKLLADNFKDEGVLLLSVDSQIIHLKETSYVDYQSEVRTEVGEIEDFLE